MGQREVKYLGHIINKKGINPSPDKVDAITNFKFPSTISVLRNFLGTINFYRKFVKDPARILAPLNKLLEGPKIKESTPIVETRELRQAFDEANQALSEAALLVHPNDNTSWEIFTDASDYAIGAVLQQHVDSQWQSLAFFSKKQQPLIAKLSTYNRELHAVYEAVRHFRYIFEGKPVTIFTDHKTLLYAFQQHPERASPWQFRRSDFIGQFTSDIRHVSGQQNIVADMLSCVEAISAPITTQKLVFAQTRDQELQNHRNDPNLAVQWEQ